MLRDECRVGMAVEFGRENGEWTKGVVVKMNPKKCKVRTLETRGAGRGNQAGAIWGVPYSMMRCMGNDATTNTSIVMQSFAMPNNPAIKTFVSAAQKADEPIPHNQFRDHAETCILEAICSTYNQLSPEWLTCDGELPAHQVNERRMKLNTRLNYLFKAFGREVSETAAYKWEEEKRAKA